MRWPRSRPSSPSWPRRERHVAENRFYSPALTPLFEATVQALDEAVIDALLANQAMTGRAGFTVPALPHDEVRALLREHKRLAEHKRVVPKARSGWNGGPGSAYLGGIETFPKDTAIKPG